MVYTYQIHEFAHEEYILAYEWYELKEKGLGTKFMQAVDARIKQILLQPEYYNKLRGNYRQVKVRDFPFTIVFELFP